MIEVVAAAGVQPSVLAADTPLTAILAIGSNAGPQQLARKFPLDLFPEGVIVPVSEQRCSWQGSMEVVWSACCGALDYQ